MPEHSNEKQIKKTMKEAGISNVSIASVSSDGKITPTVIALTENDSKGKVTPETSCGAASLSKVAFTYLVLKLIRDNKTGEAKGKLGEFKLPPNEKEFNLDTPIYKVFPDILKKFREEDKDKAKQMTARMILSHTTGLPIGHHDKQKPIEFQFEPGTQYGYSGPGIVYLQEVIDALTGSNLEALAKEHMFREGALDMKNSSFLHDEGKPPNAANSLYTTPTDYAKLVRAWMNDPTLQHAFEPKGLPIDNSYPVFTMKEAFLPEDWGIKDVDIPDVDREHVSWGLGWGLQLDDENKVISAYHSGDMNEWRAWVAMDLKEKTATVYCCESHNGHILAEKIMPVNIKLDHVFNFFFETYGFARNSEELSKEKGVESANGLREGCLELHVTDRKMAKNTVFGGGSNTANILRERQDQTTTAKLMSGTLKQNSINSPDKSSSHTAHKDKKNKSKKNQDQPIIQNLAKSTEQVSQAHKRTTPFSKIPKPSGHKG